MAPRNSSSTNGRRLFSMPSFRRQGPRDRPLSSPGSISATPTTVTSTAENSILTSNSVVSSQKPDDGNLSVTKGWLYKWTNYIKGYQKRWFILENGLLHYYKNKADIAKKSKRCISLHKGHIFTEEGYNFVVSNAGGSQIYHLRATSEEERRKWVTALERAKSKSRTISQNYDWANKRSRFDHMEGQHDMFCPGGELSPDKPFDTCQLFFPPTNDLYAHYPNQKTCCRMCAPGAFCSPMLPDWIEDGVYVGVEEIEGRECDVWYKDGSFSGNYWMEDKDGVFCRFSETTPLGDNPTSFKNMTFFADTFSTDPIPDSVFEIPDYCFKDCENPFPFPPNTMP